MKLHPFEVEQPWIPQRFVKVQPPQFRAWTFMQRKVFALVDGKRNTFCIAWMLSTTPEQVTRTLRGLQLMHMVVWEQQTHV